MPIPGHLVDGDRLPVVRPRRGAVTPLLRRLCQLSGRMRDAPAVADRLEGPNALDIEAVCLLVVALPHRNIGEVDEAEGRSLRIPVVARQLDGLHVELPGTLQIALLDRDAGAVAGGCRHAERFAKLAVEQQARVVERRGRRVVSLLGGEHAGAGEGVRSAGRHLAADAFQGAPEPRASLRQIAANFPEAP